MNLETLGLLVQLIIVSGFLVIIFLVGLNAGSKGQEQALTVITELNRDLRARLDTLEALVTDLRRENVTLAADRDRLEMLNERMAEQLKDALGYIENLEKTVEKLRRKVEG